MRADKNIKVFGNHFHTGLIAMSTFSKQFMATIDCGRLNSVLLVVNVHLQQNYVHCICSGLFFTVMNIFTLLYIAFKNHDFKNQGSCDWKAI